MHPLNAVNNFGESLLDGLRDALENILEPVAKFAEGLESDLKSLKERPHPRGVSLGYAVNDRNDGLSKFLQQGDDGREVLLYSVKSFDDRIEYTLEPAAGFNPFVKLNEKIADPGRYGK